MLNAKTTHAIVGMVAATIGILLFLVCFEDSARAEEAEITEENWTEMVAFAPDLSFFESNKDKKIKKKNVDVFKAWIPDGMIMLIKKYALSLELSKYLPVHPSEGYIEATNEHRGKAKIINPESYNKRGLTGYVAGLPFPKPKTGIEVAWNHQYAYAGDDGEIYFGLYWISGNNGVEHSEEWRLVRISGTSRTDIDPKPAIESFVEKGLRGAGLTYALAPYDKKGFGAVYFRSLEPKSSQGHIYVPSMRRILRNSFGTRGDTWNGTDLLYEDVRGYSGYAEWMNWKLIAKKTVLLPIRSGVELGKKKIKETYDFKKWPHWNPKYKYEPRPTYVLEVTPKLPDYPYSKQLIYFDAETFHILYKESYDRKGELWKIMINSGSSYPDMDTGETIGGWSGTVIIDLQAEHATVFHVHKARVNVGFDPNMFSLANLRKRSN